MSPRPPATAQGGPRHGKHLSLQGDYLLGRHGDLDLDLVPQLPECSSLLSEGSNASDAYSDPSSEPPRHQGTSSGYATLKRIGGADTSGTGAVAPGSGPGSGSLLVLQMEHERERGNLSRCLTLAREREALERELRKYASDRHSLAVRDPHHQEDPELVWKTREGASPSSGLHSSRGRYSPGTSGRGSTRPSSSILWETSPLSSPTRLVPVQTHGADEDWTGPDGERAKRSPLCESEADLSPREQHRRGVRQGSELRGTCVSPERLSVAGSQSRGYQEEAATAECVAGTHTRTGAAETQESAVNVVPDGPDECTFIEMSVDGPEIEKRYHTIAADRRGGRHTHTHWDTHTHTPQQQQQQLQRTDAHTRWEREVSSAQPSRTLSHLNVLRPDLRRTGSLGGSQRWHGHQSTQSLDYRNRGEFLAPDAWVHSLNQGRASSAVPFATYPQREDQDQDQDQVQVQGQEFSGDPCRGTPNAHSRNAPTPQLRETPSTPCKGPQSPPPRGATPNPSYRDAVNSPDQRPDPRRQASTFPKEFMGNPRSPDPKSRGSRPRERREGYPTPDRGTSPPQTGYPTPDRGTSPPQTGYPTSDRGTSPPQTGYPTPDRGTSPPQTGYPTSDRGTSPPQTGYPTSDRGTSPPQTGYSAPGRGRHPHRRALSPLVRSSSPPESGLPLSDRRSRPPSSDGGQPQPGSTGETYGWHPASWVPLPGMVPGKEKGRGPAEVKEKEETREESQEVDAEIRGYRNIAAETEERYRSYASQSSGRGSLDPPSSLSPPPTSSPETTEESEHEEKGLRRRGSSVDENYEWDTHYVPMKSVYVKPGQVQLGPEGESRGQGVRDHLCKPTAELTSNGGGARGMFPSIRLLKSGGSFYCAGLPHHRSAELDPETVLF
ncbi:uncharacterized protein LOC125304824 [Alosa alosa]|uniref:uncharacterized protein LOC125304824 n=1 Tax=Alosa alosa TaxID=278164 RepID=UPI0020151242|nr:uncharacterized protein LOC125304824 [Alosa alosa]